MPQMPPTIHSPEQLSKRHFTINLTLEDIRSHNPVLSALRRACPHSRIIQLSRHILEIDSARYVFDFIDEPERLALLDKFQRTGITPVTTVDLIQLTI